MISNKSSKQSERNSSGPTSISPHWTRGEFWVEALRYGDIYRSGIASKLEGNPSSGRKSFHKTVSNKFQIEFFLSPTSTKWFHYEKLFSTKIHQKPIESILFVWIRFGGWDGEFISCFVFSRCSFHVGRFFSIWFGLTQMSCCVCPLDRTSKTNKSNISRLI